MSKCDNKKNRQNKKIEYMMHYSGVISLVTDSLLQIQVTVAKKGHVFLLSNELCHT